MKSQRPCYLCSKTTMWQTESGIAVCPLCALANNISTIKLITPEKEEEPEKEELIDTGDIYCYYTESQD